VNVSTGVSGSTPLGELTESQAEQVCAGIERAVGQVSAQDALHFSCTLAAVSDSLISNGSAQPTVDVATCEQSVQECLANISVEPSGNECDAQEVLDDAVGCSATVSELERCIGALVAQTRQLASITCQSLANDPQQLATAAGGGGASLAPECQGIQAQCPAVIGADSGSSSGSEEPGTGMTNAGCTNTCGTADDDECDDGGPGSLFSVCALGTDCDDCGPR
jgi:hypothetical protein